MTFKRQTQFETLKSGLSRSTDGPTVAAVERAQNSESPESPALLQPTERT